MSRLVIIDDDLAIHALLRAFFEGLHHQVHCFENLSSGTEFIFSNRNEVDLIISDLRLPDGTGLDLMPKLRSRQIDIPVIMITAFGSTEIAASALKQGLFDYITKPLNLTELEVLCNRAIKMKSLERSLLDLRANATESGRFNGIVGNSAKMLELYGMIDKIAGTTSNVLISGESGTGKELVAKAIHERGPRAGKKFVALNCSAIPFELLESELFGYKRGAFTGAVDDRTGLFEEADGGTLFLDEIGDMPALLQAKLLRVLQEKSIRRLGENVDRSVDVRIIAATHKDLKTAIQRKEFREDLYFRLCVIKMNIPSLSERREDIPLLATFFLRKFAAVNGKSVSGFTREAMAQLMHAPWAGNVRELENTIERAAALCSGSAISDQDLNIETSHNPSQNKLDKLFSRLLTLKELEKEYIHHVLTTTGGKKEQVAAILGIDRKTLYRKEREYELNS